MTIFSNGDLVQVGFELDLPQHKEEPMYGRVICVNAVNPQELTVLALIIQNMLTSVIKLKGNYIGRVYMLYCIPLFIRGVQISRN